MRRPKTLLFTTFIMGCGAGFIAAIFSESWRSSNREMAEDRDLSNTSIADTTDTIREEYDRKIASFEESLRNKDAELKALANRLDASERVVAQLEQQLGEREDVLVALGAENDEYSESIEKLENEVLLSYGTWSEAGNEVGSLFARLKEAAELSSDKSKIGSEVHNEAFAGVASDIISLMPLFEELNDPNLPAEDFAAYQASLIGSFLGAESKVEARIKGVLKRYKALSLDRSDLSPIEASMEEQLYSELGNVISSAELQLVQGIFSSPNQEILRPLTLDFGWQTEK